MKFFDKKNQKIFDVGKFRKYDEEKSFFFEEKTFSSSLNLLFYQIGKAQNMPVVVGCVGGITVNGRPILNFVISINFVSLPYCDYKSCN